MDFKDMHYILALAKYGNITKAAEAVYLTQPSFSRFLQNMESSVGQPLFKRLGNKYIPTYIGERYIAYAREVVNIENELNHEVGDIIKRNVGVLKVGFPAMRGTYMLPCTLPIFRSLYPNVKIDLHETNSEKLMDLIMSGEIDLAFFNMVDKNPNLDYEIISHEEVVLVMSKENKLAERAASMEGCKYPHIDLHELENQGVILQLPNQRTRRAVDKMFKAEHVEPNIILETSNIEAEAHLAARDYGVCFITETHLKHIGIADKLRYFSVGRPATYVDFVAAYRRNSYLPYHAQEYIKIVKEFT